METPYVISFDDFLRVCDSVDFRNCIVDGVCEGCNRRRACRYDKKERDIEGALHMNLDSSRFPKLLEYVQKEPSLLYFVPASIYEMLYGSYHQNLPCPFTTKSIIEHIVDLKNVYNILTDTESKITLLNVLLYRLTINKDYILRAYSQEPQYFIQPFRWLGSEEVFVDCGAYNGDTFEMYCKYNHPPKAAYLFEPDHKATVLMNKSLQKLKIQSDVKIIEKGVYQHSGQLFFVPKNKTENYLSDTEKEGSIPINVTSIDEEIVEDVSFIKMDVEGLETLALIGAKKHIENAYPKLAICIYHNPNDLWKVPMMISRNFQSYTHYELRHHSKDFSETVLYVYR